MGGQPEPDHRLVRFGVFELNPATGELRKHGVRVRLQDQPLRLLLCLLEKPGEICTREDLIDRIWSKDTFVDYERGLNTIVTRLRQVIVDSADTPRYVETVGRKGYRFIAPVDRTSPLESIPPADGAGTDVEAAHEVAGKLNPSRWWPYATVLAIGLVAGGAAVRWRSPRPAPQQLVRLSVELGPEIAAAGPGTILALSPDGTRLALVVRGANGTTRLATRRLDQSQLTPLALTEGAGSPFFSPDGQWIAFFADGKLKKIAVQGGAPVALAEASTYTEGPFDRFPAGSWGDDGNIVAMLNPTAGLMRVPSAGPPAPLPGLTKGEGEVDTFPQVLPGSQAVLFTRHTGVADGGTIEIFSFKTGTRKAVLSGGYLGRYLHSGHLVYIRQHTLLAVPFDLSRLAMAGVAQPVLEDIIGNGRFDFSRTGSFIYFSREEETPLSIFWLDIRGGAVALRGAPGASYADPRFSPDGKRLAFSMSARGHQDIWVEDLDRGTTLRLTALPGVNDTPVWTADGWNLIFRSVDHPNPGIYGVRADGSMQAQRLLDLSTGEFPASVSPDGKRLALWTVKRPMIWMAPVESGPQNLSLGKPASFLLVPFDPVRPVPPRSAPAFSPDDRWLAYCSNESGQLEVYVIASRAQGPRPGRKWRISSDGGKFPVWSRNGPELFFLDLKLNQIMVTSYQETGDSFLATKPRVWSDKPLWASGYSRVYDLAPDGKRFTVVLLADGTAVPKPVTNVTFLLNFFDELRRRVPLVGN